MPEIIPRRAVSRGARLFQVLVAVLAGMASLYCLQNLKDARVHAAARGAAPAAPAQAERVIAAPAPSAPTPRPDLPKSNMMIKPEAGGVRMGVTAVFGEEAPPEARREEIKRRENWREVKLKSRPMDSKFARVSSEGSGFKAIEHRVLAEPVKDPAARDESAGATILRTVEKDDAPPAENLVASPLTPELVVEKPFWTEERAFRVGGSALIAIAGFLYLLSAGGVLAMKKIERAEGEL